MINLFAHTDHQIQCFEFATNIVGDRFVFLLAGFDTHYCIFDKLLRFVPGLQRNLKTPFLAAPDLIDLRDETRPSRYRTSHSGTWERHIFSFKRH